MWRKVLIVAIPLLFVIWRVCISKAGPEASYNFVMSSADQRVSWHHKIPVTMYIDSNVPSAYYSDIQTAMDTWNHALHKTVFNPPEYTNARDTLTSDGANEIFWVTQNWFGRITEQARTSLYYADDQIYEADVHVDAQNFNLSVGDPEPGQIDFQSLILHELGHVLGLRHIYNQPSVMNPTLDFAPAPDAERRIPQLVDVLSLEHEY